MARVKFYDDTEEILVWNAVDLVLSKASTDSAFYDTIDWYEDILAY